MTLSSQSFQIPISNFSYSLLTDFRVLSLPSVSLPFTVPKVFSKTMAEAALFSIAGTVLNQLRSKVLQEAALLWGIGDDIKKLTRTLSSIQAVLLDAEEQSHSPESHQLRLWLKELRQIVFYAEDLLDDFSVEVRRRQVTANASERISKEVKDFFSNSNQVAYGLKIAHGIQDIRAKLDDISERREMFSLEVRPVESMATKSREQTHSDVPEMVVGREGDKERVLEQLLHQSSRCKGNVLVVSIVGIGGLGKTTLAQLLYNDATVNSHFEVKAWVCVSDNFDVQRIVEKIIESCTKKKPDKDLEMDTLREELHNNVNEKRYLIVLDDVWSEDMEKWSRLKGLLKGGAEGSRIVITTRLLKVAKLAATRGLEPYELKGLDEGKSWSLFREIAFEGGEATSRQHESIGREILEKCKGVPLAIKTVAGALSFKDTEFEWVAFKSKGLWEMDNDESDIMPTLKLSYYHLPTHLKHCFAYCSLFPKGYKIEVERLIYLWIAQGFVEPSDPSQRFDVGLEYFKDLLWRSFFQEAEKGEQGNIMFCKMHDLMHDLAMAIAGEESVALVVSNSQDLWSYDSCLRKSQHVSLDFMERRRNKEVQAILSSIMNNEDANKLRTLLSINPSWIFDHTEPIIFSNTTSLRALVLSDLKIRMVSHTIHKLKHLKYFDLSRNVLMKMLPEEITELVNLEVLKLDNCGMLEQLPKGIGKLSYLFHLGLDGCESLRSMPRGIGQLCYLRELQRLVIAAAPLQGDSESSSSSSTSATAGISELRNLNNLRGRLRIQNLENVKNPSEGELANLKDKQRLEELDLEWGKVVDKDAEAVEGRVLEALRPHHNLKKLWLRNNLGPKCPSWILSLTSLVELQIEGCQNWKRLPSLDQLPFLAELVLRDMDSLEYIDYRGVSSSSSPSSFYPSLKSLILEKCPQFKGWITPRTAVLPQFPHVSKVEICDCDSITYVPYFSLELQTLKLKGGSKGSWRNILKLSPSSSSSALPQFSCHLNLSISWVLDLDTWPEEVLLGNSSFLASVETLTILDCRELRTLSPALLHHLTSLQHLNIWRCEKLDLLCDGDDYQMMQQQHDGVLLPCLWKVHFIKIPKLSRLPEWLLLAPGLLEIWSWDCPITHMPEWMPKLVRLQRLRIDSYRKSTRQCLDEDWPKIAHIPYVRINYVVIQEDGHPIPLEEYIEKPEDYDEEEYDDEDEEEDEEEVVTEAAGSEQAAAAEEDETSKFLRCCSLMKCNIFCRCFQA